MDGDLSGGPLIDEQHLNQDLEWSARYFEFHGVHAQNYHIFTPAVGKEWALAWGCQPWIKGLPYANIAYSYDFGPGEPGKLIAEFWITPFDYAGHEGPGRAVESVLKENKKIGLTWAGRLLNGDNIMINYDLAGEAALNRTGAGIQLRNEPGIYQVKMYRFE